MLRLFKNPGLILFCLIFTGLMLNNIFTVRLEHYSVKISGINDSLLAGCHVIGVLKDGTKDSLTLSQSSKAIWFAENSNYEFIEILIPKSHKDISYALLDMSLETNGHTYSLLSDRHIPRYRDENLETNQYIFEYRISSKIHSFYIHGLRLDSVRIFNVSTGIILILYLIVMLLLFIEKNPR